MYTSIITLKLYFIIVCTVNFLPGPQGLWRKKGIADYDVSMPSEYFARSCYSKNAY